ncbi:hypothetical protein [Pseudacidobacterium ailaaui]|uniref:hypothetical protein n=1 Tax=Pseudacidobacterium ailaaui TaxID=1382359 RepID=UPI00047B6B4D|nr:hypothetical protein [Pseudacidobacterium ailaaui]
MKSDLEKKLDAALCRVTRVQPPPGLEDRVRVRLELESMRMKKRPSFRLRQFFRVPGRSLLPWPLWPDVP